MGKRLYVGNLSWDTTEDTLRDAFEQGGRTVSDCHIVIDRETGRSRGFGFVRLGGDAAVAAAIDELDGIELGGRVLGVDPAPRRLS